MKQNNTYPELDFIKRVSSTLWEKSKLPSNYWLTRFVLLRLLGIVYFFAFLSLFQQVLQLIGSQGLLPAKLFIERISTQLDYSFTDLPSLFWFGISDTSLLFWAGVGLVLSVLLTFGLANVAMLVSLWFIYMSYIHIGQIWFSYGWETLLLETTFISFFFVPLLNPFPFHQPPPTPVIWLFRWLTFRIYIGAGLIKIRGDQCWRDLSCMLYHYETQPIPNPLSPWFHSFPPFIHKLETIINHIVELLIPFFIFLTNNFRYIAGVVLIGFQVILILGGNLSFLNWLTITATIACFDDTFLLKITPNKLRNYIKKQTEGKVPTINSLRASWLAATLVCFLSIPIIFNLLSPTQAMNASFNQLHLVNTYGAFGSINKTRYELVFQGTESDIITNETEWKEYTFNHKPTDVTRPHTIIAPYQPRIDWQLWFAAMQTPNQNPWLVHLVWKVLNHHESGFAHFSYTPFPNQPPKYVRIVLFEYTFNEETPGVFWDREPVGLWLNPMSVSNKNLVQFVQSQNW